MVEEGAEDEEALAADEVVVEDLVVAAVEVVEAEDSVGEVATMMGRQRPSRSLATTRIHAKISSW